MDDHAGRWLLWTGSPDDSFWEQPEVAATQNFALLANVGIILLTISLLSIDVVVRRHQRLLENQNRALESAVEERTRDLREARDAALAADDAKSQSLANMSHEIRIPLNGVIGMADLLEKTELDGEQREFIRTIRTSGETLLTVISDVLDLSKIESGNIDLEEIPFDLAESIEDSVSLLAARAAARDIELICDVARSSSPPTSSTRQTTPSGPT